MTGASVDSLIAQYERRMARAARLDGGGTTTGDRARAEFEAKRELIKQLTALKEKP